MKPKGLNLSDDAYVVPQSGSSIEVVLQLVSFVAAAALLTMLFIAFTPVLLIPLGIAVAVAIRTTIGGDRGDIWVDPNSATLHASDGPGSLGEISLEELTVQPSQMVTLSSRGWSRSIPAGTPNLQRLLGDIATAQA